MGLIKSILKTGIKDLPENFKAPAQSIPNVLKKAGVKDEELKFAGLDLPQSGQVSKEDLVKAEAKRKDKFDMEATDAGYNYVSLTPGQGNPTYKENVYTFKGDVQGQTKADLVRQAADMDPEDAMAFLDTNFGASKAYEIAISMADGLPVEQIVRENAVDAVTASRYTSEHFPEVPNYLMHTRTYSDTLGGANTRVVQEIQSDLHQQGRQQGYGEASDEVLEARGALIRVYEGSGTPADEALVYELSEEAAHDYSKLMEEESLVGVAEDLLHGEFFNSGKNIPTSPYEKTWLRKGIEREVENAVTEGQQLAIPISGPDVDNLKRADGVQKWYKTQVANTAKKVAKAMNMDFELVTKGGKASTLDAVAKFEELGKRLHDANVAPVYDDMRVADAQDEVERFLGDIGYEGAIDDVFDDPSILTEFSKEGGDNAATYAVIKPKDAKTTTVTKHNAGTFSSLSNDEQAQAIKLAHSRGSKTYGEIWRAANEVAPITKTTFDTSTVKPATLYTSVPATVLATYTAVKAGYTDEQINQQLESKGYDEEDIADIKKQAQSVEQAKAAGYDDAEIQEFLQGQEPEVEGVATKSLDPVKPVVQDDYTPAESAWLDIVGVDPTDPGGSIRAIGDRQSGDMLPANELVAKLEVLQPAMSTNLNGIAAFFGNQEAVQRSEAALEASVQNILDLAKQRGLNLEWQDGNYITNTEDGPVQVTPGMWDAMTAAKGEVVGATAGAIAGAKVPGPWWAKAGGSVAGAMIGSVAGTEMDYIGAAMELSEDMSAEIAAHKAYSAAELSMIGDAIGYPIAKFGSLGWKSLVNAKNAILNGNEKGAYQALKDTMFLNDDQVGEIVANLKKSATLTDQTMETQAIRAVVSTQPGAEGLVKAASALDPQAANAVAKSIDTRAQDVKTVAKNLTDPNMAIKLKEDLSSYTTLVKENFGRVKALAANSPKANNVRFDYNKLAIEPVLETLQKNIMNPNVLNRYLLQAQRIRDMSSSRTFTDLLELRKLVNDFRFNSSISRAGDKKVLSGLINNIDGSIRKSAGEVFDNPGQWLGDWKKANRMYAEMKTTEKNVLFKLLNRPGVSPKVITMGLSKYISAADSTFNDVMQIIPAKQRADVEGSVVNHITEKYTAGLEGGQRAINFPLLAKELDTINLTTSEARRYKAAVSQYAEIFKNDVPLAQVSGTIQIPKFQSYLTTDPLVRAKFEIASGVFNYVKRLAPGKEQRNLALVKKTADLLESPLNAKNLKAVMEDLTGNPEMQKQVNNMVEEAAKRKAKDGDLGAARVQVYGDGKTLSLKPTGGAKNTIPVHRIASTEQAMQIATTQGINPADKTAMDWALKQQGYSAVQVGTDKVRRLK